MMTDADTSNEGASGIEGLDPHIVRRLLRPVERPGVVRVSHAYAIAARAAAMLPDVPLADQLGRRWREALAELAGLPPIVYAQLQTVPAELPATSPYSPPPADAMPVVRVAAPAVASVAADLSVRRDPAATAALPVVTPAVSAVAERPPPAPPASPAAPAHVIQRSPMPDAAHPAAARGSSPPDAPRATSALRPRRAVFPPLLPAAPPAPPWAPRVLVAPTGGPAPETTVELGSRPAERLEPPQLPVVRAVAPRAAPAQAESPSLRVRPAASAPIAASAASAEAAPPPMPPVRPAALTPAAEAAPPPMLPVVHEQRPTPRPAAPVGTRPLPLAAQQQTAAAVALSAPQHVAPPTTPAIGVSAAQPVPLVIVQAQPDPTPPAPPAAPELDMDVVVSQVERRLRRSLATEMERRGRMR